MHLIYRKYIYLYYSQAVTLQEGPGAPRQGLWAPGEGECHIKRQRRETAGPAHLFTNSWESKGSWAKVRGPPRGNKWGLLVTWGKPGTPQKSLKIKNHQGRLEWGVDVSLLGISPSIVTTPGGPGATPRQTACDCARRVSPQRQET